MAFSKVKHHAWLPKMHQAALISERAVVLLAQKKHDVVALLPDLFLTYLCAGPHSAILRAPDL